MSDTRPRLALLASALFVSALAAQVDLDAARAELDQALRRPANTVIGDAQKQALAAFLERHAGQDLGPLGYARAMHLYLQPDMAGAVAELDRFFSKHDQIQNDEHRSIVGRVYLSALANAARSASDDEATLREHATKCARLYGDLHGIARLAGPLLAEGSKIKDRAGLRLALLRGALARSEATGVDEFAASLYAGAPTAATRTVPAARIAAPTDQARPQQRATPASLDGHAAPDFAASHVIDPRAAKLDKLALQDLRGKVVVLDFWATWCPPCRAVVPHLVELQTKHKDDIAVLGVTRFSGRGMDFSAPDATKPHGGKSVNQLDEAGELAINRAFAKAFELNYPIVFVDGKLASQSYHVSGIPTVFVLDRQGQVVGSVVGGDGARVDALVEQALARK